MFLIYMNHNSHFGKWSFFLKVMPIFLQGPGGRRDANPRGWETCTLSLPKALKIQRRLHNRLYSGPFLSSGCVTVLFVSLWLPPRLILVSGTAPFTHLNYSNINIIMFYKCSLISPRLCRPAQKRVKLFIGGTGAQ